jgi:hypothetical protein
MSFKLHKGMKNQFWNDHLDLTLMQHPHDEDPEPREMRPRLEVEPLRA